VRRLLPIRCVSLVNVRLFLLRTKIVVGSYPFRDCDPFILNETPHLFFAGNQPEFKTKIIVGEDGQRVRLVAVPKFSETGKVVLVDVDSLAAEVLTFALNGTGCD
jgi:DNA polymerase delta subunit 2